MKRERIAVLTTDSPLAWQSCSKISGNLTSIYGNAFGKRVEFFSLEQKNNIDNAWKTALAVRAFDPGTIVYADHRPHPALSLRAFAHAFRDRPSPTFIFHLYGNFTIDALGWLSCMEVLKGRPVRFLCASERQALLVRRFLAGPGTEVALCPFPVDDRAYVISPRERSGWRRRLGFAPKDRVLLYCGRLSLQKNVDLLLAEFLRAARTRRNLHLLVAGMTDDLGASLFGWFPPVGALESRLERTLLAAGKAGARVRWLGQVDAKTLNGLYNAADAFASLSLHHDEDFGMSAAEARMTGLPLLLTEWGGYADFLGAGDHGVKARLGARGLTIDRTQIARALATISATEPSPGAREEKREAARARFSVRAVTRALENIIEEPAPKFTGFTNVMSRLAFCADKNAREHFDGPRKNDLYEEIYASYFDGR